MLSILNYITEVSFGTVPLHPEPREPIIRGPNSDENIKRGRRVSKPGVLSMHKKNINPSNIYVKGNK